MRAYGLTFLWDGVRADGGRFTTDPKRIARDWPPRRVRLRGIAGAVTRQRWGRFAKDMSLTLEGQGNHITGDFKAYLDRLAASRTDEYLYRDFTGIEATVVIADFVPVALHLPGWWDYSLTLEIKELDKLDGVPYTGE